MLWIRNAIGSLRAHPEEAAKAAVSKERAATDLGFSPRDRVRDSSEGEGAQAVVITATIAVSGIRGISSIEGRDHEPDRGESPCE
jgi:hypothetical protein